MVDDEQNDPMWKPGDLDPMQPMAITLTGATHTANGTSQYGEWFLWVVEVENAKVHDKKTKKVIEGFTGKAICFPSEKLQEKFLEATNGTKEGVTIEVTMVPKKTSKGSLYTNYETKVLEEGVTDENTLQGSHNNFLKDFKAFVDGGAIKGVKEDFMGFGKTDAYKIPEATLEKLWNVYNERN